MNFTLVTDYLGLYAPGILGIFSLFLLRNKINYFNVYIFGYAFNIIVNIILKLIFKQPRPTKNARILEIAIENRYDVEFDKYGMPSGHAQACVFSLVFITLVLNSPFISSIYLALTILTFIQRYKYLDHTIFQLIIGSFVGFCIGYLFYNVGKKYITGNIKMRPDDFAPK